MAADDALAFLIAGEQSLAEAREARTELVRVITEQAANGASVDELRRARNTLTKVDRKHRKSQASFERSRRVIYRAWPHLKPENTPHG